MDNFRLKIIVSVYVCLISLALYNSIHSYYNNIEAAKAGVIAKLSAIATITGSQINGDAHQRLIKKYQKRDGISSVNQDEDYKTINAQLATIQQTSNINTDIYTLFPTSDFKKFYFGVNSNTKPYFRHLFHIPPAELIKNYTNGGTIDEYEDENGIWLSAFTPIKNSKNQVVAVVQIDKNFAEFKAGILKELITNILLIVVCYSVIGFLLYLFLKSALEKEELYLRSQEEYNAILAGEVDLRTVELSKANEKLNKLNKELESFFYSTSHDIRGPLCRILGLSSLAKMETDKQELVELIEVESQKMDEMLKKMILVNTIRTKSLNPKHLDLSKSISLVLTGLKGKYKFVKQDITDSFKNEHNKSFNCDIELFESAIVNLLDNAFKFCDHENPVISVDSSVDERGIFLLSVRNNGKVFSEIEKNNAFELFKRANKQGDMDTLRLGLYAIKTSLDRLNGVIDIHTHQHYTEIKIMIPDAVLYNDLGNVLKAQLDEIA